jgi:hypothetical protein
MRVAGYGFFVPLSLIAGQISRSTRPFGHNHT